MNLSTALALNLSVDQYTAGVVKDISLREFMDNVVIQIDHKILICIIALYYFYGVSNIFIPRIEKQVYKNFPDKIKVWSKVFEYFKDISDTVAGMAMFFIMIIAYYQYMITASMWVWILAPITVAVVLQIYDRIMDIKHKRKLPIVKDYEELKDYVKTKINEKP